MMDVLTTSSTRLRFITDVTLVDNVVLERQQKPFDAHRLIKSKATPDRGMFTRDQSPMIPALQMLAG